MIMIKFLRKLFCIHAWEYEDNMLKHCRKCEKETPLD